ncbi:hypothetical protein EGT67_06115 [Prescottella agglutinans]|uniref:Uncharacterized protein n=1 Tax=Prescottella agglutinans TaxID=1644129 RepID=A0A3S3BGI7_9NOCA|nr:hypothetical protein EGT67_06115 [Prescottella agglutinans]
MQVGRPSPWRGSEHFASHGWDFDDVDSLPEAASRFAAIAEELMSAHSAGWWLEGPMSDGRLHARRPSRRQRTRTATAGADSATGTAPALRWRVRVVDEPAAADRPHLGFESAPATPWLAVRDGALRSHAVIDGVLVRTVETLGHRHAADRAASLPDAGAAYRRLAAAATAMHRAGGRLVAVDDGFLVVEYPQR